MDAKDKNGGLPKEERAAMAERARELKAEAKASKNRAEGEKALRENIVEMAEQIFDLPVRIGYPQGVTGRIEDVHSPRCTTAVGLVLHGSKAKTYVPKESGGMVSKLKNWVKNIV